MKKFLLVLFACILFIPGVVKADGTVPITIDVFMEPVKVGDYLPSSVTLISEYVNDSEVSIEWYESSDGNVYNEVVSPVIDYNKYYRFTIVDEINVEDEHETNNYMFNGKSYSSKSEFVIEPFRKYYVHLNLEGLEFNGMTEVVEGEHFRGSLIPKKGYRLPVNDGLLEYNLIITVGGNKVNLNDVYNIMNGDIGIESDKVTGDIMITATGRDIAIFEFTSGASQKYEFGSGKPLEFIMSADISLFENQGVLYINEKEVDPDYYTVEEGSTKFIFKDEFVKQLEVGEYELKAEFYDGEAKTTFSVVKKVEANPNTSDNIMISAILSTISVMSIFLESTYLYLKRKRTN